MKAIQIMHFKQLASRKKGNAKATMNICTEV